MATAARYKKTKPMATTGRPTRGAPRATGGTPQRSSGPVPYGTYGTRGFTGRNLGWSWGPGGKPPTPTPSGGASLAAPPAVAPPGSAPPPRLPETEAARATADEQLRLSSARIRRGMYEAAMRYGDQGTLAQFADQGPTVENPNSALSTIGRREGLARTNEQETRNRAGTFYSGIQLRNQGLIGDQMARERLQAQTSYENAYNELYAAQQAAQASRDEAFRNATAQEISAFAGTTPEPQGDVTGPPGGPAGPGVPPPGNTQASSMGGFFGWTPGALAAMRAKGLDTTGFSPYTPPAQKKRTGPTAKKGTAQKPSGRAKFRKK